MKKLFVLSGGNGEEREVSLASGRNVVDTLRSDGVLCEEIVVDKEKNFLYQGKKMTEEEGIVFLKRENAPVFQVIHGTYGEDGELVRKLEQASISYIGATSGVLELTIDKYRTEKLLEEHGISTTHSVLVTKNDDVEKYLLQNLTFPLFIKPNNEGSSLGVKKVHNEKELHDALQELCALYEEVLVQEYLPGREFSCGVIEIGGNDVALVPTEVILTKGELFDYDAKYKQGGCLEVTPAQTDEVTTKKIQDLALLVHKVCGCKDISRTDFKMDNEGNLVVLEVNTVPGMTKTSFIPEQMKASGYKLADFIQGMMQKYL